MAERLYPRNRQEFLRWFDAEEKCVDYLAGLRWPDGKFVSLFRSNVIRQPAGFVSDQVDAIYCAVPHNLHGGLLSYGHCGVAGAMAHLAEAHLQMTGRAGERQAPRAGLALLHADGGVLSSHVSVVLEQA